MPNFFSQLDRLPATSLVMERLQALMSFHQPYVFFKAELCSSASWGY
jgi:hypothetical protein